MMIDTSKSLEEIDGEDWGEPTYHSHLVTTCYRLRRKPIKNFTAEDVRIMIGQSIGLDILAPIAIDILQDDPLVECDFYPGDLLKTVISGPQPQFWKEHPDLARRLDTVLTMARERLATLDEIERKSLEESLNVVSWQIGQIRAVANQVLVATSVRSVRQH